MSIVIESLENEIKDEDKDVVQFSLKKIKHQKDI
jgi:hypothetical protein